MKNWKKISVFALVVFMMVVSFTACSKSATTNSKKTDISKEDKIIKFGSCDIKVYEDTTKILAEEVEKLGYKLEYSFIADGTQMNEAVENGELFADYYQHYAYLNEYNALRGTHLVAALEAFTDRAGIFSTKYKSIKELPDGANFSIPVDTGNNFRTFIMLADAGLIKLKEGIEPAKITKNDIVENPHKYKFTEVEYTMLSRAVEDADAGFLYATVASEINLDYNKDALLKESEKLQSKDIIAINEKNKDSEKAKILKQAYQTQRMKQAFLDAYGGKEILLPAW